MGAEAPCTLVLDGKRAVGKALLETEELVFRPKDRGGLRIAVPLAAIKTIAAEGGALKVGWGGQAAVFEVGDVAAKWLDKIRNPKSRADKLGIKAGQRVGLVGGKDAALLGELAARGAEVTGGGDLDLLFYWADSPAALEKLAAQTKKIKKDGAIWVIRPKGSAAVTEKDVYAAGRAAGLVDVKVAAFSATHTAEKMVIPVTRR